MDDLILGPTSPLRSSRSVRPRGGDGRFHTAEVAHQRSQTTLRDSQRRRSLASRVLNSLPTPWGGGCGSQIAPFSMVAPQVSGIVEGGPLAAPTLSFTG